MTGEDREGASAGASASERQQANDMLPEINFATFVASLNASALMHLGIIEEPGTGRKIKDLVLAKQTIDILGMLEQKTAGNLSENEQKMLKSILYDLRIMYIREKE